MKKLLLSLLLAATTAFTPPITITRVPRQERVIQKEFPTIMSYLDALLAGQESLGYWPKGNEDGPEDSLYVAPTDGDIQSIIEFWRAHQETTKYSPEAWDCDDFAREFLYWSRVWGRRAYDGLPASVLVGAAYVHIDGDYTDLFPRSAHELIEGYHVLNIICRADGQWFWFEPQTGLQVPVESALYEGVIQIMKLQF